MPVKKNTQMQKNLNQQVPARLMFLHHCIQSDDAITGQSYH